MLRLRGGCHATLAAVTAVTAALAAARAALAALAAARAAFAAPTGTTVHRRDAQAAPRWRQELADRMQ